MAPNPLREPVFNVPAVIPVVLAVLAVIHLVLQVLPEATATEILLALAFIPDRYSAHPLPWPGGAFSAVLSPVSHMLVHGDWLHLGINGSSLLIFGGLMSRRLGAARFLAFAAFCAVAGALMFLVFNPGLKSPMIGASGAISGMMAASLRLMFSAIDGLPRRDAAAAIRGNTAAIPLKDLSATCADSRLRSATALWLAINALSALGMGTPAPAGTIAWEAHVGGYFAGLFGLGLFDLPPGPPQPASQDTNVTVS